MKLKLIDYKNSFYLRLQSSSPADKKEMKVLLRELKKRKITFGQIGKQEYIGLKIDPGDDCKYL